MRPLAALTACLLSTIGALPAQALAAGKQPARPTFTIPASARVHGNANQTTTASPQGATPAATAPASTTPASTTPTPATPTTSTPASTTPLGAATQPSSTTPATTTPASTVPTSTAPLGAPASTKPSAQTKHAGGTHLSSGAIALIALGALLLLGCIAWAIFRQLALEPRWSVSLMYSLREAGYRGSATWAEFTDWSRLGR